MSYKPRYTDKIDDRMWGAPRHLGWVHGGLPLPVMREMLTALLPDHTGHVYRMQNVFYPHKNGQIQIIFWPAKGPLDIVLLPHKTAAEWLEKHYPIGYRLGMVYGLPGTNYPER